MYTIEFSRNILIKLIQVVLIQHQVRLFAYENQLDSIQILFPKEYTCFLKDIFFSLNNHQDKSMQANLKDQ
jgi:hypothetical protein